MDLSGKYVFLSGPISDQPDDAVDLFCTAHHRLRKLAYAEYVFNPALRHLIKQQRKLMAMGHEDWMADCLHELTSREARDQIWHDITPMKYDLLVQLPGWEKSDGAKAEAYVAEMCGIPIVSIEEALR